MRIQKPTITQITVLQGDGAQLTGSFSGSFVGWDGIDGKPDPLLSSSAQIADDISGSLSTAHVNVKVPGLLSGSAQIASNISGSFVQASASIATDIDALQTDSGSFSSRITTAELELGNTLLSSSAQIADNISGSLSVSHVNTKVPGLVSGSAQIASNISGSLSNTAIAALGAGIVSGSAQIASNISGSFVQASSSIASDIDTIQANISSNDTDISGLNSYTSSLKTAITVSGTDTTILGNLTVQGTQTQLQTATLNVEDLNITVASGSATAAAANGAGLTVAGANATLTYASTGDKWEVNKALNVPVNGIQINGTAVTATATELNILDGADTDLNTLSVPANTTISAFGATLVDDADAATARTTLGLGTAATTNSTAYATAAQGTTADAALPKAGGQMTGNITFSGAQTVDGRDLSVDGAKLDGIAASANNYTHPTYTARSIDTTGAEVLDVFTSDTSGHVTNATKRTMTLADLGYTGATNANYITNNNQLTNGAGYTTYSANQTLDNTSNVHFEGLMVGQTTGATANTIRCIGDVVAYYSSDAQFKDNVETLEGALDKVKAIRGVRFDWNDKQDVYTGHDIGVIAQEVQAVLPELVHHRDHSNSLAVDYVKLTAVLIEAVKELSAKVDELSK